ncbi:MAG: hypothetical protein AB1938_13220 [Myxococcota bacterium]
MTPAAPRPFLTVAALLAAVALGRAVQFGNGGFTPDAVEWLAGACLLVLAGWLLPPWERLAKREQLVLAVIAALALAYQFSILSSSPPAIYLQARVPDPWKTFQAGIGVAAVLSGIALSSDRLIQRLALVGLVITYLVVGKWLIFTSPQPAIDVWYIHRDSVNALVQGINPYTLTFPNIYGDGRFFGPGMVENGRLMFGYTYPPLSLLLSVPAQLIGGDYRYALLACNALTAVFLATARPSRLATLAAALFLFTPRSFFVLEQGWTEPVLLAAAAAVGFCALRFPRALPWAAGVMLASKQYAFLLAPALLLLPEVRRDRRSFLIFAGKAVGTAAALTLPFLLWDPKAFVHSVFLVQLGLPFRSDAMNFSAWWVQRGGSPPPGVLGFLMLIPPLVAMRFRAARDAGGMGIAAATTMLCFVIFNRQAFCNYYFLILGLFLLGAAWTFPLDEAPSAAPSATVSPSGKSDQPAAS